MAGDTCVMHLRIAIIDQRWWIVVTACTAGAADSHQGSMIRSIGVNRTPAAGVTAGTVTAATEVLADCKASKAAVAFVAVTATVMGFVRSTDQSVIVAAGTTGATNLNQRTVVRGIGGMS